MKLIAITGGIGSGKSVVLRLLRLLGFPVYDTDIAAKQLMNEDEHLAARLVARFGTPIYIGGKLNSARLSEMVFNDATALDDLNKIVHPAVKEDLLKWAKRQNGTVFFETALLYTAALDAVADAIWKVEAPIELRIERVKKRSGLSEEQIRKRMESQQGELRDNPKDCIINNDGSTSIVSRISVLLKSKN